MVVSALALVEVALLALGAFLWLHAPGARRAESLALGVGLALISLSCLYQAAFLLGRPWLALPVEALAMVGALRLARRHRGALRGLAAVLPGLFRRHPISAAGLAAAFALLFLEVWLVPPIGRDVLTYHLPRVLLFQQESSLFPDHFTKHHLVAFPVGADLLRHAALRFHADWGLAWPDLLAYGSIVLGCYALGRRHASESGAFCAAVVVAGFPQLVFQALTLKSNIFTAAAALWCLLLAARLEAGLSRRDLGLLLLALAFGISAKTTFLAFAGPFALFMGWRLLRAHGPRALGRLCVGNLPWLLALTVPLLILSQAWLFAHNRSVHGGWFGPPSFEVFHRNADGPRGAAANAVRYLFQSVDGLRPTDQLVARVTGVKASNALEALYGAWVLPWAGSAGLSGQYPIFRIDWQPHQKEAWYGPLGFALALPSLVLAALRGPPFLRATAATALGYWLLFSAAAPWFPFNTRMLSPVFAASGPCMAWLLDRLRLPRSGMRAVGALALFGLFYSLVADQTRPFQTLRESRLGLDRRHAVRRAFGPAAATVTRSFPAGSQIAVVAHGQFPIYYPLLANPDARLVMVRPNQRRRADPGFDLDSLLESTDPRFDAVLCLTGEAGICPMDPDRPGVLLLSRPGWPAAGP